MIGMNGQDGAYRKCHLMPQSRPHYHLTPINSRLYNFTRFQSYTS